MSQPTPDTSPALQLLRVNADSISSVRSYCEELVILEDDTPFGTDELVAHFVAQPNEARMTLASLPSIPTIIYEGSVGLVLSCLGASTDLTLLPSQTFRRLLKQYFQCDFEILPGFQIYKPQKITRIEWDPEEQRRVVAYAAMHDAGLIVPGTDGVLVKRGSMSVTRNIHPSGG